MTKSSGLAAFAAKKTSTHKAAGKQQTRLTESKDVVTNKLGKRKRGTAAMVSLTVRLKRHDWERLHQLAVSESESIQGLAVRGLSMVFHQKGLPGLEE